MKYWGLSYYDCLWNISYQNLVMLNMSIPKYDDKGNKVEAPTELSGKDLTERFKKRKRN